MIYLLSQPNVYSGTLKGCKSIIKKFILLHKVLSLGEFLMKRYILLFLVCLVSLMNAKEYTVPPTTSTHSAGGSVISDEAMEQCVKLYNEAKWLKEELDRRNVDNYDSASVNSYNNKVGKHSQMINYFNQNCAGKQSYSAWKAAQKLNSQK